MFRSIQWRIAATYVLLIVASMGLVTIYLLNLVQENHVQTFRTQLGAQARLIADASLPLLEEGRDSREVDALARRLGSHIGARVTVVARDGSVLGDSSESPAALGNQATQPEVEEALRKGAGAATRPGLEGTPVMFVAVSIQRNSQVLGVVRVALPLTQVEESLREIVTTVLLAAIIVVALTVLLAVYIARRIAGPVKEVTHLARRMAKGDLDQKIYVGSTGEVGEMAESFNDMALGLKQTIEAINLERSKLEVVLQEMADGLLMTDREGIVILANPAAAKIFGGDAKTYIRRSFIEVTRDHELSRLLFDCLSQREQQVRDVDVGGLEKRNLRTIIAPIRHDRAVYALALFQDVTELRRLEGVRREFVANISHELRTPLASVKALVETLQEGGLEEPAVARDFLARVGKEVDKLTSMVNDLLDLSRLESEQPRLTKELTDIGKVVREAVGRIEPQAKRKGLDLAAEIPPTLLPIVGDSQRLQQALMNLIDNAIKFTPEGGRIRVTVDVRDERVEVAVADTGVGIESEDLPHVFERFYKVDRSRAGKGVGLGLAIAKHIVQAHGGTIRVESALGKGSVFTIALPAAKPR
ncbi:MAG: HAMP domain-containing protein [Chloroflexi bacterium]|nr:HAMP domain-containing protein [Chloroflexota bacterium]